MQNLVGLDTWHKFVNERNIHKLNSFISDDVTLFSPVVFKPIKGKFMVTMYLQAAAEIIANDSFKYVREVVDKQNAILEFETEINGLSVNGVDMLQFTKDGKLKEIKVMIRPLKGVNVVHQKMAEYLEKIKG
jgi:hypothetical protein